MKIRIEYKNGILNIPASAVDCLRGATKTDLSLLLLLAKDPSVCDSFDAKADSLSEALGVDLAEVMASVAFWRGAGVISADDEKPTQNRRKPIENHSIPPLSSEDIERMKNTAPDSLSLVDACSQTLGRMLNSSEASCLLALREYLGIDDEYILLVAAYCVRRGKKTVRYVEKTTLGIYDDGIETTSELEKHFLKLERRDEFESKLRRLIGAGERTFTPKEKERLARWQDEYGFDFDVIELAYQKTVDATGKFAINYMDKILSSWHEKGYRTVADVTASESPANGKKGSFDTDDFFSMAVKRGLENQ